MKIKKSILISAGIGILTVLFVNTLVEEPHFESAEEWLEFAELSNRPEIAKEVYSDLLKQDPYSQEYHYGYISTHFRFSEKYRKDPDILFEYLNKSKSEDTRIRDIGFYGVGLYYSNKKEYAKAWRNYELVGNQNMKYLNNSKGFTRRALEWDKKNPESMALVDNELKYSKTPEEYYWLEIDNQGNINSAFYNLSRLYYFSGRREELGSLIENTESNAFVPLGIQQQFYFQEWNVMMYYLIHMKMIWQRLNLLGYLGALLIMGSWMMYLRKLDIYEPEGWLYIILALALGMIFSHGVLFLSDFNKNILGFSLNGELLNDFLYCVLGIGAIEELVKIMPLLLLLKFTKQVNEPYDYILYASLSALGFAFIENLLYIGESQLHIIHGRGLAAAVGHMFFSSIIAYGMILNRYKRRVNSYINFAFFFALASIAHGFWDFWLINETVSNFSWLTIALLLSAIFIWNSFKNNALNHSNFYDRDKVFDTEKLSDYLVYSLSAIIFFEYLAVSIKFGSDDGNAAFMNSLLSGTYLIFFLSSNLGQFYPRKGRWVNIRLWGKNKSLDHHKVVSERISLEKFSKDDLALKFVSNTGKILRQITVSGEAGWYVILLDEKAKTNEYNQEKVLIRAKKEGGLIRENDRIFMALFLIPSDLDIESKEMLRRTKLKFAYWCIASIIK